MSSILKALKKLEYEKSVPAPDLLKIDSDILRSADTSRSFSLSSVGLLLLFFGGGATVAYFFMTGTKVSPEKINPQTQILSESIQPQATPLIVTRKTLPAQTVLDPAHKKRSDATADKVVDRVVKKGSPASISIVSENPDVATIPVTNKINTPTAPTLRVNGISFQDSGADSMAIVNGIPVSSGVIIEGATVREVQKDRVLFQYHGEKFEIRLGQSN